MPCPPALYRWSPLRAQIDDLAATIAADNRRRSRFPGEYETILTEAAARGLARTAARAPPLFAFDTETTCLDYMQAEIVGVSFCSCEPGHAAYVPLRTTTRARPTQLDRERVLAALKPLLEDPTRRQGRPPPQVRRARACATTASSCRHALRLDARVLRAEQHRHAARHGLGRGSATSASTRSSTKTSPARARSSSRSTRCRSTRAAEYAAEDADVALRLHQVLWPQIDRCRGSKPLYEEIEQPLVPVLLEMEHHGVLVDADMLRTQSRELAKRLLELEQARRTPQPGEPSTSIRRSSSRRSCSGSCSCR